MNNEVVILRTLRSVLYPEAKNAIKVFYRTERKARIDRDDALAKALALSDTGDTSNSFTDSHGREWYLNKENAKAVSVEKAETKSVSGSESLSGMTCPKCGDSLQQSTVCPACKDGQAGFKVRYKCVCGFELVGRSA